MNRRDIAASLHRNAQVSRADIFGASDSKYSPIRFQSDAETMFAGYVGSKYVAGGSVLFGVNPGGGGDSYEKHPDDDLLYNRLRAFRDATHDDVAGKFEAINDVFPSIVVNWNLWRIFRPTLAALNVDLEQICYLNAVPFQASRRRAPGDTRGGE